MVRKSFLIIFCTKYDNFLVTLFIQFFFFLHCLYADKIFIYISIFIFNVFIFIFVFVVLYFWFFFFIIFCTTYDNFLVYAVVHWVFFFFFLCLKSSFFYMRYICKGLFYVLIFILLFHQIAYFFLVKFTLNST